MFGGISATKGWSLAAIEAALGPKLSYLKEGNQGLQSKYLDVDGNDSQAHHYAGMFFLSYYTGSNLGNSVNFARDVVDFWPPRLAINPGDIYLGSMAVFHGALLGGLNWGADVNDIPTWIESLSS